ncbi:MAG TPA: PIN domain-containing protein [Candidatus Thermoplasmatota archaeon]|nr:PIN domain-containing protein [Candidatus Thermoplasmatota archaeon]
MTDSDVFFDSDPWLEVLRETPRGKRIGEKYRASRIHTSLLSLAELGAKLLETGSPANEVEKAVALVERDSHAVYPLTVDDARCSWRRRAELRKAHPDAGLSDAMILCQAERLGFPLVSADKAFKGRKNVRPEHDE